MYDADYVLWEEGYYVQIGKQVAGKWLGTWITVTGTISALGILNSTLCTTSRALAGCAEFGYLPSFLARVHHCFKTPYFAILFNCLCIIGMVATGLDFASVAELSMFMYCVTVLIELAALFALRSKEPDLPRPYRIPLDGWKLVVFVLLPPALCCFLLMVLSKSLTWLFGGIVVLLGALIWFPFKYFNQARLDKERGDDFDAIAMEDTGQGEEEGEEVGVVMI